MTAMSKPNAAFCADIATCSFGRLFGPAIAIPAGVTYVDVAFDISYDFEALDARLGFDGASFEYQLDGVGTNRFGTSDAIDFEYRYTHRLVRASGGSAFGDRSGWSGASNGWQHVRLRIPDLAGHSLTPRLSCTTHASVGGTGVYVDNVTVTAITMDCGTCQPTTVRGPELADAGVQLRAGAIPFARSTILQYTLSERVPVRLEVFAADGRHVRTLVQGLQGPGDYDATFDLHSPGPPLAPGVYIVRLKAGPTHNSRLPSSIPKIRSRVGSPSVFSNAASSSMPLPPPSTARSRCLRKSHQHINMCLCLRARGCAKFAEEICSEDVWQSVTACV